MEHINFLVVISFFRTSVTQMGHTHCFLGTTCEIGVCMWAFSLDISKIGQVTWSNEDDGLT